MKIPNNVIPRFLQILILAGFTGLLFSGTMKSPSVSPSSLTVSEQNQQPQSESEPLGDSETESGTLVSFNTEKETIHEPLEDTASSETTFELTESASLDETLESDYAIVEREEESEDSSVTVYEYVSPYSNPDDTLAKLHQELMNLPRLIPNYLPDLTMLSLNRTELEWELNFRVESFSGDWSVYVKDLATGDVININEHPMSSASLIKLYIMGAVFERIETGKLEDSDRIRSLLNDMITVSDNNASNELVRYLSEDHDHKEGLEVVNDFIKRHAFGDTQHVNGLADSSLWYTSSENNETSARDCGELLASIYEGKFVSHLASRRMETLLMGQEITYKIPTALPSEAISASKTGEINDVENDSAIVYSPGGDFILCIMSANWDSGNTAVTRIREITKLVYNYFNTQQYYYVVEE